MLAHAASLGSGRASLFRASTQLLRVAARPTTVVRSSSVQASAEGAPAAAMSTKLYCGNLSWETRNEDLKELFSKYGQVEEAFVAMDRETGRSRGFGFVTLSEGGQEAITELNETEYMGRTIRVNEAQPQGEGGRGGGRGGGGGYRGGGGGGGRGYGGGGGGGYNSDRGGGGRSSYGERSGGGRGGGGYGGGGRGGYGGGGGYGGERRGGGDGGY